jgi:inorganic pyrophosphatase
VREWFRNYKTPDGKPPNNFGYNEEYQNREFAEHIIQETHEFYLGLKTGQRPDPSGLALA